MRTCIIAVIALLLSACQTGQPPAGEARLLPTELVKGEADCSVFSIRHPRTGLVMGTAFVLQNGNNQTLVTARHVVLQSNEMPFLVSSCGNQPKVAIASIIELRDQDVAVLIPVDKTIRFPRPFQIRITPNRLSFRESVSILGFSAINEASVGTSSLLDAVLIPSHGQIVNVGGDGKVLVSCDLMKPGGSGGPILDKDDRIVGMVVSRVLDNGQYQGLIVALPIGELIYEIQRNFNIRQ